GQLAPRARRAVSCFFVCSARKLPRVDRVRYEDAASDLRDHYRTTGKRNLVEAGCRLKHLDAFFTGGRLANIGPAEVTRYVRQRQEAGATNGTINREIEVLGKML